jgi:hypothetical protein
VTYRCSSWPCIERVKRKGAECARCRAEAQAAKPAVREVRADVMRFRPFSSFQFSKHDCDAVGVPRDKDGAAQFTSERQLNEMKAHMERTGRYLTWKEH